MHSFLAGGDLECNLAHRRSVASVVLSPRVLSFSSFHGFFLWGWGLWPDRVFSFSPGLAQRTPINNNNNKDGEKLHSSL